MLHDVNGLVSPCTLCVRAIGSEHQRSPCSFQTCIESRSHTHLGWVRAHLRIRSDAVAGVALLSIKVYVKGL